MDAPPRSLIEHFSGMTDPRMERSRRHKLIDIMVIGVIGALCGAESWEDVEMIAEEKESWLRKFLELPNGIPSHDTISRVFARLSAAELERCFVAWMKHTAKLTDGEVVAIDGKRLRRSFDKASDKAAIHMVSAWATTNGVVLGQVKVDDKSNEITAIPKLLQVLEIKGCIVTTDAMGCQKEIASQITGKGADYVFGLKGNQSGTLGAVEMHFDTTKSILESKTTTDADHGRIETRLYQVVAATLIPELAEWPNCKSATMVTSTREIGDKKTTESRYYISSLPPVAETLAKAIRGHWGIENSLHWVLDVEFDEDRSRVRKGEAPENLAVVRHIAINLLKQEKSLKKASTGRKRLKCAMSNNYLGKVLFGAD
jgi:predicted transposase YbfD/YdcC